MKCSERFFIIQCIVDTNSLNADNQITNSSRIIFEKQDFCKCYEEECLAYDKKKKRCMKIKRK